MIDSWNYIPSVDLSTLALGKNTNASPRDTTFARLRGAISKILRYDRVTVVAFVDLVSCNCTHTRAFFSLPRFCTARVPEGGYGYTRACKRTRMTHQVYRIVRVRRTKRTEMTRKKDKRKRRKEIKRVRMKLLYLIQIIQECKRKKVQKNSANWIRNDPSRVIHCFSHRNANGRLSKFTFNFRGIFVLHECFAILALGIIALVCQNTRYNRWLSLGARVC